MSAGYVVYSLDWDKFMQLVDGPTQGQLATLANLLRVGLGEQEGEFDDGDPILEWTTDDTSLAEFAAQRLALPDWYGDLSLPGKNLWQGVVFTACMNYDDIDVGFRVDHDGLDWDVIDFAWKQLGVVPNTITEVAVSALGTRPFRYHQRPQPGKSREQYDREQDDRSASLGALSKMLGQFWEDAKPGQKDPGKLLDELQAHEGISREHKNLIKDLLSDEESEGDYGDFGDWSSMHSMHTPEEVKQMLVELKSLERAIKATKQKTVREQYHNDLLPVLERVVHDGRMLFIQVDD